MKPTAVSQPTTPAGRRRPLRQTLLAIAGLLFIALSLTADDCKKVEVTISTSAGQTALAYSKGVHSGVKQDANGPAYNTTFGATFEEPNPKSATITYTPPVGATNITFDVPPSGQNSDGSYFWNVTDPGGLTAVSIVADYTMPGDPDKVVSTVTAIKGDTKEEATSSHTFQAPKAGAQSAPVAAPNSLATRQDTPGRADPYYLWHTEPRFYTGEVTLTVSLCQDLVELLQSQDFFFALRVPVYPPTLPYTAPYTLPVVFKQTISPTLRLVDRSSWPFTTLLRLPLRYRPEYFTFLETELPSAAGEHWLALGAVTTPTMSCAGIPELPGDDWDLRVSLDLDLGGAQGGYAERVLTLYYGYRGQDPPFFFQTLGRAAGGVVTSYQGWGITAIGPHPVRLIDWYAGPEPSFEIDPPHIGYFTPTQTISMAHSVFNEGVVPVTVTLDYTTTLGLPWGIYSDTAGAIPLVGPVRLEVNPPANMRIFYLITALPAGTPSGIDTLLITATDVSSPTRSTWTSDLVWIGDWLPPPLMPAWRVYLPLVVRNW